MKIAINSYISSRGISGSAIAVSKIEKSLIRLGHEIVSIKPTIHFNSRMANFIYLVLWDIWICSRKAIKAEAEMLINTCNTGLRTSKIPSILVMHDTMVLDNKKDFDKGYWLYAKLMFWLSARNSQVIMTPSEFSKKSIARHWPKRNIKVNYWPIEPDNFNSTQSSNGNFQILWNAAMEKHKQPELLLDIAVELKMKIGSNLKIHIVTRDGNAWNKFFEKLQMISNWTEWIYIYTNLTSEELTYLYDQSDVLIVTSKSEGFCLPALEAMAKSVPVVHNNIETLIEVCGYELENHDSGILFSMTDLCKTLFDDSEKFKKSKRQAQLRSLNFSEERFDEQLKIILEEALINQ